MKGQERPIIRERSEREGGIRIRQFDAEKKSRPLCSRRGGEMGGDIGPCREHGFCETLVAAGANNRAERRRGRDMTPAAELEIALGILGPVRGFNFIMHGGRFLRPPCDAHAQSLFRPTPDHGQPHWPKALDIIRGIVLRFELELAQPEIQVPSWAGVRQMSAK